MDVIRIDVGKLNRKNTRRAGRTETMCTAIFCLMDQPGNIIIFFMRFSAMPDVPM